MWIVKFSDNTRHSAWNSKREAMKQAEVMRECGMLERNMRHLEDFVEYDDTVQCENGHYYV